MHGPSVEPLQGSVSMGNLPRVALRLPWADGFNPFGVKMQNEEIQKTLTPYELIEMSEQKEAARDVKSSLTGAPDLWRSAVARPRLSVIRPELNSNSGRRCPRPRRGLRVKPGAGTAEPTRRGASPGKLCPPSPALKGRNPEVREQQERMNHGKHSHC